VNLQEPATLRNSIPNISKYINIIVAIIRYMKYQLKANIHTHPCTFGSCTNNRFPLHAAMQAATKPHCCMKLYIHKFKNEFLTSRQQIMMPVQIRMALIKSAKYLPRQQRKHRDSFYDPELCEKWLTDMTQVNKTIKL
jgi:hypothetical protein